MKSKNMYNNQSTRIIDSYLSIKYIAFKLVDDIYSKQNL